MKKFILLLLLAACTTEKFDPTIVCEYEEPRIIIKNMSDSTIMLNTRYLVLNNVIFRHIGTPNYRIKPGDDIYINLQKENFQDEYENVYPCDQIPDSVAFFYNDSNNKTIPVKPK